MMKMRTVGMIGFVGLGLVVLAGMPGCIAWDIKDQIELSNQNLERIEHQLISVDENLVEVNEHLGSMDGSLESMDTQLADLQQRLDATNAHLESLRQTINNIDKTIPFLSISGDDEEEQAELENQESVQDESDLPASND